MLADRRRTRCCPTPKMGPGQPAELFLRDYTCGGQRRRIQTQPANAQRHFAAKGRARLRRTHVLGFGRSASSQREKAKIGYGVSRIYVRGRLLVRVRGGFVSLETALTRRLKPTHPVVQAPLAGGGDTPDLVAAVSNAGAPGFMGAAYLPPELITATAATVPAKTSRPFGINLFAHLPPSQSAASPEATLSHLAPYFSELGLPAPSLPKTTASRFDEQLAESPKHVPDRHGNHSGRGSGAGGVRRRRSRGPGERSRRAPRHLSGRLHPACSADLVHSRPTRLRQPAC